jgi:small basic protein (TIGR04137 family)
MSQDRSLKIKGALSRHRNVLSRAERIEKLAEGGIWQEGDDVTGLPKVGHRKIQVAKKESKKQEGEEETTEEAAAE